jgi:DNA-binding NtrC family response regulator
LVEDEEQVHNVVQEALEDLGYRVLTTTNAAEAIALLEARGHAGVDLLFTDIVIPGGMDGLALAKTAAERWPWLPVLITTGFSPNAVIDDGSFDARFRIIGKPYSFDLLAGKVRECLDGVEGFAGP